MNEPGEVRIASILLFGAFLVSRQGRAHIYSSVTQGSQVRVPPDGQGCCVWRYRERAGGGGLAASALRRPDLGVLLEPGRGHVWGEALSAARHGCNAACCNAAAAATRSLCRFPWMQPACRQRCARGNALYIRVLQLSTSVYPLVQVSEGNARARPVSLWFPCFMPAYASCYLCVTLPVTQ